LYIYVYTDMYLFLYQMIEYNVAGGKLNRGLTVLSVQGTFAKAKGKSLTDKVRYVHVYIYIYIHTDIYIFIYI
jgi:hypothetical protein